MAVNPNNIIGLGSGLYTDASDYIGGSSAYHVDINFRPLAEAGNYQAIVAIMDAKAQQYASRGYFIEFSNSAVSGETWNVNASMEEKIALAQRVMQAHGGHSNSTAMDYYIVPNGKNRHDESVNTQNEIAFGLQEGWRAEYASGGRYGNHTIVYDQNGNEVYRMGHGSDRKPVPSTVEVTQQFLAQNGLSNNPEAVQQANHLAQNVLPSTQQVQNTLQQNNGNATQTYDDFMTPLMSMFGGQEGMGGMLMPLLVMMIFAVLGEQDRAPTIEEYKQNPNVGRERLEQYDREQSRERDQQELPRRPGLVVEDISETEAFSASPSAVPRVQNHVQALEQRGELSFVM